MSVLAFQFCGLPQVADIRRSGKASARSWDATAFPLSHPTTAHDMHGMQNALNAKRVLIGALGCCSSRLIDKLPMLRLLFVGFLVAEIWHQ
jgi:hypothetical protein